MISFRNFNIFLLSTILLFFAGCKMPFKSKKIQLNTALDGIDAIVEPVKPAPQVTVWIHGTQLTPKVVMPNFFHREIGLNPALVYAERYHLRKIAESFNTQDSELYPLENFYIFGWNGKLSFVERQRESQELYYELMNLYDIYHEKYGVAPHMRLITHSHGGNVALNLARVKERNHPLIISELIMLACPVQAETMHLINDPLFKKIYSFYSEADLIQVIDPQGLYHNTIQSHALFSKRLFPQHPHVCQIKTKFSKRGLAHVEFLLIKFLRHLPNILKDVTEQQRADNNNFAVSIISETKRGARKKKLTHPFVITAEQPSQSPSHQFAQKQVIQMVTQNEEVA
ncbi:MAG: hypothetical protein M1114_02815 [Candidatus Dependentiae bacterium]|nr:hypothetical protein [Candidatus Dependentiae bacterium]